MRTVAFNGGGADGKMDSVQVPQGSEYPVPECDFYIDGCTFDLWAVYSSNGGDPIACHPGDVITVDGDMMVVASWQFDEEPTVELGTEVEAGEDSEPGAEPEESGEVEDSGLAIEDGDEETDAEGGSGLVLEDDGPSEVGSVFSGAGIAAIIAAVALAIAAAGIMVAKKKQKK